MREAQGNAARTPRAERELSADEWTAKRNVLQLRLAERLFKGEKQSDAARMWAAEEGVSYLDLFNTYEKKEEDAGRPLNLDAKSEKELDKILKDMGITVPVSESETLH